MSLRSSNLPPQRKQHLSRKNILTGPWKFRSLLQTANGETAVEKCDFSFGSSKQISRCVAKHFSLGEEKVSFPYPQESAAARRALLRRRLERPAGAAGATDTGWGDRRLFLGLASGAATALPRRKGGVRASQGPWATLSGPGSRRLLCARPAGAGRGARLRRHRGTGRR